MNKRQNIVHYPVLGAVSYVKSPRAKNLSIRISRSGDIRVTFPNYVSYQRAEGFVLSKAAWIQGKTAAIRSRTAEAPVLKEGDTLDMQGQSQPIVRKHGGEDLEEAVWRMLLGRAKDFLPGRVESLALEHGLSYSGIRIRQMRSRWGSCTVNNSINLNSWLVMLPERLIDYVILHELTHTLHKDHGKRFWSTLDAFTAGQSKALRRELQAHQIMNFRFA